MSEITAYSGREGRHSQHLHEKNLSAADYLSILDQSRAEELLPELQARPK